MLFTRLYMRGKAMPRYPPFNHDSKRTFILRILTVGASVRKHDLLHGEYGSSYRNSQWNEPQGNGNFMLQRYNFFLIYTNFLKKKCRKNADFSHFVGFGHKKAPPTSLESPLTYISNNKRAQPRSRGAIPY